MRRIGVLINLSDVEGQSRIAAFREGLQNLGWTEGGNIQIRHQPHLMPKRSELARPVVRRCTRFQLDHTARHSAEERKHLPPPHSLTQNRGTLGINAVNLKNMLG
jgi:hypothetical protein